MVARTTSGFSGMMSLLSLQNPLVVPLTSLVVIGFTVLFESQLLSLHVHCRE